MPDESSSVQSRPFLPFEDGPKNQLRKRGGFGRAKPRENAARHGANILRQAAEFQTIIDAQEAKRSSTLPNLPDEIQVILETDNLSPEAVSSLGLTFVEEREEGTLVTISPDANLTTLTDKTQSYMTEQTPIGRPKLESIIAPINSVRPATREDKVGDRLNEWIDEGKLHPDDTLWLDVELRGGRTDEGEDVRERFYSYVNELNEETPDAERETTAYVEPRSTLIEEEYSLHRVLLPGRAIEDLLNISQANWILLIDLIPEIEDETMRLREVQEGALLPLPVLSEDAPRVVVIDSGIAANHPLFSDAEGQTIIGRQVNFLPNWAEPSEFTADEVGHGTAIASITAYGLVKGFVLDQNPETFPVFWVENAKILLPASKLNPAAPSDYAQLHPSQIPKALMRKVVAALHQPMSHHCKIFNLSVNSAPHRLQQPISNWAEELDNLSADNDILFVVSAGNLTLKEIKSLTEKVGAYPQYLLDHRARLRNPAQAYTALIVGALTHSDVIAAPFRKNYRPFTHAHYPAPFSRSGLLNDGVVKPDVVEIGGNLSYDESTEQLKPFPELSVPVANLDFIAGQAAKLIGFQHGTSVAAPKVTNLAGRIQAQNPDASANLIRALVVNSAEWPKEPDGPTWMFNQSGLGRDPNEFKENMLRLCGYGVPQADKALSANTHCMVFVTEDEFSWAENDIASSGKTYRSKVSFFEVHFDNDALFTLPPGTLVRVSITLAYNPKVRKTRRQNYQSVELRWELKRRDEFQEGFRLRWLAETENETELEDNESSKPRTPQWPWQLRPVLNPRNKNRRGTIIRDWFEIQANKLPNPLDIVILAKVAPWRTPPHPLTQQFALVVSVESRNQAVPIYEIRAQSRVQVRTT